MGKDFLGKTPNTGNKIKHKQMGLHATNKLLHNKGNNRV
jgi:hypothetical protein